MTRFIFPFLLLAILPFSGQSQIPTWAENIAPIIFENCSSCHHEGGIAPFELMEYEDVAPNAEAIYHEVFEGRMPPWPADPDYMHFIDETVLEQEEIDDILNWLNAGMPFGDADLLPEPPVYLPSGSLLDQIDYTVEIEPYTLQSNSDEYRWFVIENPFEETFYISKLEVIAGLENVVHHADLFLDYTGTSLANDLADPLPGFNYATGFPINNHYINAWQPGGNIAEYPENWGFMVPPNADLVIEIHYGPGGIGQVDSTKMNIQFVNDPIDVRPVQVSWYLNESPAIFIDGPLVIPANEVVTFHQVSQPLSNDMSLISICPHMHFLGKSYRVWYEDIDGTEYPLIDIPQWDFHWQKYYTYPNIMHIPAGSVIKSEAVYDNTSDNHDNPFDPPQTAVSGGTTMDEMFLCYFIYANYQEGDEFISMEDPIVGLNENLAPRSDRLTVYPNPVRDILTFTGGADDVLVRVELHDSQGRLLGNHETIMMNSEIDIRHLNEGLYFIRWKDELEWGLIPFVKQ